VKADGTSEHGGAMPGAADAPAIDQGAAAVFPSSRMMKPAKRVKLLRKVNWAYFDPIAKEFVCRRCEALAPLERDAESGPIDTEDFLGQMLAFEKAHKKCGAAIQAVPSLVRRRRAS